MSGVTKFGITKFGITKFGITKPQAIIAGVVGIVLASALIPVATQAKEKWLSAQAAPTPATPGIPGATPTAPDAFNSPSQIGTPTTPSAVAPVRPRRTLPRPRRIPIEPVPLPGDTQQPLPELKKTLDIRNLPASDAGVISGISGKVAITPICSVTAPSSTCLVRPYTGGLKISTAARDRVIRLSADDQGAFRLRLTPGIYVIEPDSPNFPIGSGQTFAVVSSVMRQMDFNFQGTIAPGKVAPDTATRPAMTR